MDLNELHPGHVIKRIEGYRFVVSKSLDTRSCRPCGDVIPKGSKFVRKSKKSQYLYRICSKCVDKEIASHVKRTKQRR